MMRATYGVTARTSVAVGRTSPSRSSHGCAPGGISVIDGSSPWKTVVAKMTTSAEADHELGHGGEQQRDQRAGAVEAPSRRSAAYGADRDRRAGSR